jgi:hypothetical protein
MSTGHRHFDERCSHRRLPRTRQLIPLIRQEDDHALYTELKQRAWQRVLIGYELGVVIVKEASELKVWPSARLQPVSTGRVHCDPKPKLLATGRTHLEATPVAWRSSHRDVQNSRDAHRLVLASTDYNGLAGDPATQGARATSSARRGCVEPPGSNRPLH